MKIQGCIQSTNNITVVVQTFDDCTVDRRSAFTIFKGVKKWTTLLNRVLLGTFFFDEQDFVEMT